MKNVPDGPETASTHEPTTATAPAATPQWSRIGPYALIERLGEGGMGEVWLAEQTQPIRRRVALKIIKRGLDTDQVVARFEAERQALALMNHPCVARVYDAGSTPDGRPYFAMEAVQGVPITQHCDRFRLTTRERLRVFIPVCEGVQHAHQKAIIHRDLKPSNVLVAMQDDKAIPKIIDFGVAKAMARPLTERTLYTEQGVLVGTPEYMSPEQADLTAQDIDTRSDVYSLGVLLYEILVGALPFDSRRLREAGFDGTRRIIREEEPLRPTRRLDTLGEDASTESARRRHVDVSTLRRQLAGDLDWIIMRALEKDRTRRYGSPADLAADIERHLNDQPVLAGPPGVGYRARKFVRRHVAAVAATAGITVLLLALTITMSWQARRIARERDRADREARTATRALGFLSGLFKLSGPEATRGRTISAREILDRGAARLGPELSGEPASQAVLMDTIGMIYSDLGLYDSAAPLLEQSLALRRKLLGDGHPDTLTTMSGLAMVLWYQGHREQAETYFRGALDGRRRVLGPDHPDTLKSVSNLAGMLGEQGKLAEAEALYRESLAGLQKARGDADEHTLNTKSNLGYLLRWEGKLDEAERYCRDTVEGYRRLQGPDHPDTLGALEHLGSVLMAMQKPKEAEPYVREALEGEMRVLGPDHRVTLETMNTMAELEMQLHDIQAAETWYNKALEGQRRTLGSDHPDTLRVMSALVDVLAGWNKTAEAEAMARDVLARRRRVLGSAHPETFQSVQILAGLLVQRGEFGEAEKLLTEATEGARQALGEDHPDTIRVRYGLACLRARQGQRAAAIDLLRQVVEHGFAYGDHMAQDADLKSLHGDPEFENLVERARENSRHP